METPRRELHPCQERGRMAEDAGGRRRRGGNMLFFGFRLLHHLVSHLGVCGGFLYTRQETNVECGVS